MSNWIPDMWQRRYASEDPYEHMRLPVKSLFGRSLQSPEDHHDRTENLIKAVKDGLDRAHATWGEIYTAVVPAADALRAVHREAHPNCNGCVRDQARRDLYWRQHSMPGVRTNIIHFE